MNLMFYDFNNSSASVQNNTAQNFYNPASVEGANKPGERPAAGNGDRVPTRERGGDRVPTRDRSYRSANLNYRRRG